MMVVAHNLLAMNGERMFGINTKAKAKSTEKLSSGYRVNRAADDAAGLAMSEKMRRQIRGLRQGANNIQDGISVCQVMDGALTEIHDMLHRMTELAVKAENGTLSSDDRGAIQDEVGQILEEIDRTTGTATFNEKLLLRARPGVDIIKESSASPGRGQADVIFVVDNTGSMGGLINNVKNNLASFADGLANCDTRYGVVEYGDVSETIGQCNSHSFVTSAAGIIETLENIDVRGGGDEPESALEAITAALDYPFRDGATKEIILVTDATFHYSGDGTSNPSALSEGTVIANRDGKNARVSVVTSNRVMDLYQGRLANGKVLDINDNFYDSLVELASDIANSAGEKFHKSPDDIIIKLSGAEGDTSTIHTYNITAASLGLAELSCETPEGAQKANEMAHKALKKISEIRAQIGAEQNGLEHRYNLNNNVEENTQAAESRIRDTDMAEEMMKFTTQNILAEAGVAMLTQANQTNQGVLSLLS